MSNVQIINHRKADIELPAVLEPNADKRMRSKRVHGSRRLVPGKNVVPADYLKAIEGNPQVKILFDEKMLEVVKGSAGEGKKTASKKETAGKDIETVRVMVNACDDMAVLEAWAAGDSRKEVTECIIARMEILEEQQGGKEAKKGV